MASASRKSDPFGARDTFSTSQGKVGIYRLSRLEELGLAKVAALPYSIRVLLENAASFYGSQMTAMDSASKNAGEMIDSLTLTYNRARQAKITKELIEIVSGAEALK